MTVVADYQSSMKEALDRLDKAHSFNHRNWRVRATDRDHICIQMPGAGGFKYVTYSRTYQSEGKIKESVLRVERHYGKTLMKPSFVVEKSGEGRGYEYRFGPILGTIGPKTVEYITELSMTAFGHEENW